MTATDVLEWGLERARAGPWRGDGRIAFLAPVPDGPPPSVDFVRRCVDALSAKGFSAVITSALSTGEQRAFLAVGFEEHERLALLAHDMRRLPSRPRSRLVRGERRHATAVLELDWLAFPPFWRLANWGLDDAISATPDSRYRVALGDGGEVAGYAICGRAGRVGYVQRLAVHPRSRRRGLGSALVADGLRWMGRRGVKRAVVNTQTGNDAATALYLRAGFRLEPSGLVVLRRRLEP